MIPEPTDEDFARDADSVYAEAWRLFQLGVGRKEPEALAWIRLAEHYRIGRRALLKREGKALQLIRKLEAERDKLQKFKDFVHAYLTQHGVPEDDTTNEHSKAGCRIGARLDWVLGEMKSAAYRAELAEMAAEKQALMVSESQAERDRLKAYTETFGTCETCDEWDDPGKPPPSWVVCFRCWNAAMLKAQKEREAVESERDRLAAENAELRRYIACRSVETFNDSPSMQREKP